MSPPKRLSIQWVDKPDLVQLFNGDDPVGEPCSFYELSHYMGRLAEKFIPPPCSTCEGVDSAGCPACQGTRVRVRTGSLMSFQRVLDDPGY